MFDHTPPPPNPVASIAWSAALSVTALWVWMQAQLPEGAVGSVESIIQYGALGVFLWWLMLRVEKRLEEIQGAYRRGERAADRTTRALLLLILAMDDDGRAAKDEARKLIADLDRREDTE